MCLRSLDCAPHLPLTPRATYPELYLGRHSYTSIENLPPANARIAAFDRARGAVQGGR